MHHATTPTTTLALCAALTLACGGSGEPTDASDSADVQQELAEAADEVSAIAARRRQDFRRLAQQRLDRLEERMELWSEEAEEAQREALAELKQRGETLSEQIDEVRGVSEERWNEFQRDVQDSLDALEREYEELVAPAAASRWRPPATPSGVASELHREARDRRETDSMSAATMDPDDTVDAAISLMRKRSIRRLPVVDGEEPVGVVSLGDLARERDPHSVLGAISAARSNV